MLNYAFLLPLASALTPFIESNLVGKVIVVILVFGSMFVWSLMLGKSLEFASARRRNAVFHKAYRRQRPPVGLYVSGQDYDGTPLHAVYKTACSELVGRLEAEPADAATDAHLPPLTDRDFEVVRRQAERVASEQLLQLERNMVLLATASSVAPFLGLLGTVVGVMEAFGGMGTTGAAMLSEVAPGISGALLTTVVGLIVALPSSIGYNMLGERLRELEVGLDGFVEEFAADVASACRPEGI